MPAGGSFRPTPYLDSPLAQPGSKLARRAGNRHEMKAKARFSVAGGGLNRTGRSKLRGARPGSRHSCLYAPRSVTQSCRDASRRSPSRRLEGSNIGLPQAFPRKDSEPTHIVNSLLFAEKRRVVSNWFAIARQYCYWFLLIPLERCWARKIAECMKAPTIQSRGSDHAGYRNPSRPARLSAFRSSRSAPRLAGLTPAESFWTRFRLATEWPSSSFSISTRPTTA